jgi:hypothetical protein
MVDPNTRGRPARHTDLVAMTDALDAFVGSLRPTRPSSVGDDVGRGTLRTLSARWLDAVGPTVAAHASPVRIDGTRLVVVVDDPAWGTQLRFLDAELRGRLERVLGAGSVREIDVMVRRDRRNRSRVDDTS